MILQLQNKNPRACYQLLCSHVRILIDGACGSRQGNEITNAEGTVVYMKWGGDNTEDTVGYESIYIDVPAIKQIPGFAGDEIELDLRAIWYSEVGQNPVIVTADGYQGGSMLLEAETPNVPGYGFLNPTSTRSTSTVAAPTVSSGPCLCTPEGIKED